MKNIPLCLSFKGINFLKPKTNLSHRQDDREYSYLVTGPF